MHGFGDHQVSCRGNVDMTDIPPQLIRECDFPPAPTRSAPRKEVLSLIPNSSSRPGDAMVYIFPVGSEANQLLKTLLSSCHFTRLLVVVSLLVRKGNIRLTLTHVMLFSGVSFFRPISSQLSPSEVGMSS